MTTKQIVFTEINTAKFLDTPLPAQGPHDVTVRTAVSTVSAGTERANITGDPNVSVIGESNVVFPRMVGYSSAGTVVSAGCEVKDLAVGDRVAVRGSYHRTYNVVPAENAVKIESDALGLESAAMAYIATFPMAAIRKTRLEMGESVLVMGLGILGMIAVKLLRAAGATPIVAVDPKAERRAIALKNGADYAFDPFAPDFAEAVKAVTDGGAKVAIEVTGVGAGLNGALDCMAKFGRVALLGCTRNSDFTVDYYKKVHGPGISLIGAHTIARPEHESYPGYFTHRDDMKAVMRLCASGRLSLADIVGETHSPEECEEVYRRLVSDKDFPIAVQFDWRSIT